LGTLLINLKYFILINTAPCLFYVLERGGCENSGATISKIVCTAAVSSCIKSQDVYVLNTNLENDGYMKCCN
jgi:hypothetical protein